MTLIKQLYLAILILFSSCNSSELESSESNEKNPFIGVNTLETDIPESVELNLEYVKSGSSIFPASSEDDSTKVYHLKYNLKNNGSSTVNFITMTCSSEDMFISKNFDQYLIHPYYNCYSNYPRSYEIRPDSTYSGNIMIRPLNEGEPFIAQLGFLYIKYEENMLFPDLIYCYENRAAMGSAIWSNEIGIEN